MLEVFRNAAKSWVAKVLLGLLILSFAAWGITDVFTGGGSQDLAEVGKQRISGDDYTRAVNRATQQYSESLGRRLTYEDVKKQGIDVQVRDSLIAGATIDEKARLLGVQISAESVAQQAASNPAFRNSSGQFDRATFQRVLEANGLSEGLYLQIEQQNRARAMISSTAPVGIVPATLLQAEQQFRNEVRSARYFSVSVNAANLPQPTPDDLKKQYEATPRAYTAPEFRSVAVLKADPADTASRFEVSEAEIKNGFERYKAEYAVPERRSYQQISFQSIADADKAQVRIKAGEDFLIVASDLGFKATDVTFEKKTKADVLDTKIADAVFATALNTVSAPVQGGLTTAIVKVTAIEPGKEPVLAELKDQIKQRVQLEKAVEDIQSIFDTVEELRSNDKSFEDIAAQLNIPLTIVPAINATGTDKAGAAVVLPAGDELLRAVFETDVGAEQDALNYNDGFIWYQVREIVPSALRPLNEVEAQVKTDWQATKLRGLAEQKAKDIVAKAKATTPIDELAKEHGATVKTAANLKRGQATPEFDGLAAIALFGVPEKTYTWALEGDGKTARVIYADKVEAGQPASDDATTKQRTDEVRLALSRDMEQSFLKSVRASVPVEINDVLWERLSGASQ